jgi:hypothetical protein
MDIRRGQDKRQNVSVFIRRRIPAKKCDKIQNFMHYVKILLKLMP